jgi:hypothetical protein
LLLFSSCSSGGEIGENNRTNRTGGIEIDRLIRCNVHASEVGRVASASRDASAPGASYTPVAGITEPSA